MINATFEIAVLLSATAVACSLLGVFLVLRRMALISDAMSHVLLLGIVVAYFFTHDLNSPWLLMGAALSGVLTVGLIELLQRSKLVKEDAAIGLVFPALFSIGILLASMFFRNTHLDVDQVLLGQPLLAPLRRLEIGAFDFGPTATAVMSGVLLLNILFVMLFFKELKLTTFDAALATTLGFLPGLLHYALMGLVSLTAVTAFDAVGPVLVVGFMIVPPATAYLLTDRLGILLLTSAIIAVLDAVVGTWVAVTIDTNIAGTVATVMGICFGLVFLLAPQRGLIVQIRRRARSHRQFLETMLLVHLLHHSGTSEEGEECNANRLHEHLRWTPKAVAAIVAGLTDRRVVVENGLLRLTVAGRQQAEQALRQHEFLSPFPVTAPTSL